MRIIALLLLTCASLSSATAALGEPGSGDDVLAERIQSIPELKELNGNLLVASSDQVLVHVAFGRANIELGVPNTTDTRYVIASVIKPLLAVLTIALVEEGSLDLHAPISDYLPDYTGEAADRVTIHHLLSHQSGIPNFAKKEFYVGIDARLDYTRQEFITRFCSGDLSFEPGSKYSYSDPNYVLLGAIVEAATDQTLSELFTSYLFVPAEMTHSSIISDRRDLWPGTASSYVNHTGVFKRPDPINYADAQFGAGNMISTASDLHKFVIALRSGRLVSQAGFASIMESHVESETSDELQGYGWNLGATKLESGDEIQIAYAPGNNGGYNAFLQVYPETGHVVVLLLNVGTPWLDDRLFQITRQITELIADR